MTDTAIVFGATGFVGNELVRELLETARFSKVKVVVRNTLPISHNKLDQLILTDFGNLDDLSRQLRADVYFCCIGTTIKKAGSREAFCKVDLDIPVKIATIAESLEIPSLVVISSIGASSASANFYLRTKGEMENKVQSVYHGNLKFVRPSLIMGNRPEFRFAERLAQVMTKITGVLMIGPLAKYKGIHARVIARGMIKAIGLPRDKIFLESDEIHKLALK